MTTNLSHRRRTRFTRKPSIPPHSWEAHLPAKAGEANKTLVIAIISIIAIVLLGLLVFFASQFVGKAISPGAQGVQIELNLANNNQNLVILAHLGSVQVSSIYLEITPQAPMGGGAAYDLCTALSADGSGNVPPASVQNQLNWVQDLDDDGTLDNNFYEVSCSGNTFRFSDATLNDVDFKTGNNVAIATLTLNPAPAAAVTVQVNLDLYSGSSAADLFPNTFTLELTPEPYCTGPAPTNAQPCAGDEDGLTATLPRTLVASCTAAKCQYTCTSPAYTFQSGQCVCSPGYTIQSGQCLSTQAFQCTGAMPANSTICVGDNQGLTANTPISLVASCGAPKCEYRCLPPLFQLNAQGTACVSAGVEPPPEEVRGAGGGGFSCEQKWSCSNSWTICNATLQQSRACIDLNNCDLRHTTRVEVQSCSACPESWVCLQWSSCQNNQQARQCVDEHYCGTQKLKPVLSKGCKVATPPGPPPARIVQQLPPPQPLVQQQPLPPQVSPILKFWQQYKVYLLSGVSALAIIILLSLLLVHHFRVKKVVYNINELKEWIKAEKAMGTSDENVKAILAQNTGWGKEEVDHALQEALGRSPETSPGASSTLPPTIPPGS